MYLKQTKHIARPSQPLAAVLCSSIATQGNELLHFTKQNTHSQHMDNQICILSSPREMKNFGCPHHHLMLISKSITILLTCINRLSTFYFIARYLIIHNVFILSKYLDFSIRKILHVKGIGVTNIQTILS